MYFLRKASALRFRCIVRSLPHAHPANVRAISAATVVPPHRMYLLAVGVIRVRTQLPAYFCLRLGVLGSLVVSSLVFDVAPTRCRGGLHLRCSFYGYQAVHEQCRHRAMFCLRPVLNAVRLRISLLDVKVQPCRPSLGGH